MRRWFYMNRGEVLIHCKNPHLPERDAGSLRQADAACSRNSRLTYNSPDSEDSIKLRIDCLVVASHTVHLVARGGLFNDVLWFVSLAAATEVQYPEHAPDCLLEQTRHETLPSVHLLHKPQRSRRKPQLAPNSITCERQITRPC